MNNFPAVEEIPGVSNEITASAASMSRRSRKEVSACSSGTLAQEYNGSAIALTNQAVNNTQMVETMHRLVAEEKQIRNLTEFLQERITGSST